MDYNRRFRTSRFKSRISTNIFSHHLNLLAVMMLELVEALFVLAACSIDWVSGRLYVVMSLLIYFWCLSLHMSIC